MSDPTGTAVLRRSFQAEGNRRLAQLRSQTYTMLVEHDLMAARNGPLASLLPHPGDRLAAFTHWFEGAVDQQLLGGRWWERFLERAYQSGFVAGSELAGHDPPSSLPMPLPAVFRELATREFAGIAAALVQQVTRQAAGAAIGRRKPQRMYRQVLPVLRQVGGGRVRAAANTMAVRLHNAGRLEQFRAAGITRVGIDPERLHLRKPSKYLRHDHGLHVHVHDRETEVERRLREVNELLEKLRNERGEASALAQVELAAEKVQLEAEIEAHVAGAEIEETAAQARAALAKARTQASAEVATAKAATAAGEAEAAAAWERVKAARAEERRALYPQRRPTEGPPQRVPKWQPKPGFERVAQITVGVPEIPERLKKIGSEFVNVETAGDERVCDICNDLMDEGPYSLAEAQSLIPAHPNCRCAFIPFVPEDDEGEDDDDEE